MLLGFCPSIYDFHMLQLPDVFQDADFALQPETPGLEGVYVLTWPRDTFVAARGAILVGLPAIFALCSPFLFLQGYRLEAIINMLAGSLLAVVFHRHFFSRMELIFGPRRLAQRFTWRGRMRVVEYDPAQPCQLTADRPDRDANAEVRACDLRGRWRCIFNDDHWRAEIFCRWLNQVLQGAGEK